MNNQTNGSQPKPVATVQIQMLSNGQVAVECQGSPMAIFTALGEATKFVAGEVTKQQSQQIQAAPPGLVNRLIQG